MVLWLVYLNEWKFVKLGKEELRNDVRVKMENEKGGVDRGGGVTWWFDAAHHKGKAIWSFK